MKNKSSILSRKILADHFAKAFGLVLMLGLFLSPTLTKAQTVLCQGDQVNIVINGYHGAVQWESSSDGINWMAMPGQTGDTLQANPTDSTWYRAAVTDGTCPIVYSDTTYLTLSDLGADAGPDMEYCVGASGLIIGGSPAAISGVAPYSYSWEPGTGLSNPAIANPIAMPTVPTNYILTVTDSVGCTAMDTVFVDTSLTAAPPGSQTFIYTGTIQYFVIPPCVDTIKIECWGAEGGAGTNNSGTVGGKGGYVFGDIAVNDGDTFYVYVGERGYPGDVGGWNGGGSACAYTATCARGGGASDVRYAGIALSDRIIVGGGGGGAEWSASGYQGGDGGGLIGGDGNHYSNPINNGHGGTQSMGGAAGTNTNCGTDGSFGLGGDSGDYPGSGHSASGGGGWYGGGGSCSDGHAGGGSSYYGGMDANTGTTLGLQLGDGQIIITW